MNTKANTKSEAVRNEVISAVCEQWGLARENVDEKLNLKTDIGLDSLDAVEFVMKVEDSLSVTMDESALAENETVGDIISYVTSLVLNKDPK